MKEDSNIEEVEDKKKKQFLGNLSDTELALFLVTIFLILVCSFVINTKGEAELHGHETIRNDTETVVDDNSNNNQENTNSIDNQIGEYMRDTIDVYDTTDAEYDFNMVKKLLDRFGFSQKLFCLSIFDYGYSDTFKALIAMQEVEKSKMKEIACSDIFDEEKFVVDYESYGHYQGDTGICLSDKKTFVISYQDANEVYQKMYSGDLPKQNIDGRFELYLYNYDYLQSSDSFVELKCGECGGTCAPHYEAIIIKSVKDEKNKLYIDVYYLRGVYDTANQYHIESSSEDISIAVNSGEEFSKIVREKFLDKLDVYEIVFYNTQGDYIFESVEKK